MNVIITGVSEWKNRKERTIKKEKQQTFFVKSKYKSYIEWL